MAGPEEEYVQKFETLQLHAGQEPDPTTKSRAVPIYATTVGTSWLPLSRFLMLPGLICGGNGIWERLDDAEREILANDRGRASPSMIPPMAPASSGSRSLAISTVGL